MDFAEDNAAYYVAGYLFRKCKEWHACPVDTASGSASHIYIGFKQYDNAHLVIPPMEFVDYMKRLEECLNSSLLQCMCQKYFDSAIFDILSKVEEYKCCEEFDNIKLL